MPQSRRSRNPVDDWNIDAITGGTDLNDIDGFGLSGDGGDDLFGGLGFGIDVDDSNSMVQVNDDLGIGNTDSQFSMIMGDMVVQHAADQVDNEFQYRPPTKEQQIQRMISSMSRPKQQQQPYNPNKFTYNTVKGSKICFMAKDPNGRTQMYCYNSTDEAIDAQSSLTGRGYEVGNFFKR